MAEEADVRLPPDKDRGPMLLAISWTLTAMASTVVALRVYCRTILQNAMGWDDFAILAALVGVSPFRCSSPNQQILANRKLFSSPL